MGRYKFVSQNCERLSSLNPINPGLFDLELTLGREGCVFHPPAVTLLSLKLCDPNLVQTYFRIRPVFCGKKD